MCIPFCYPNGDPYWQLGDEQIVWHHLAKLLRSNRTKKIGQNGQYDMQILLDHGVYVSNYWMDTMCAFHSTGNSEFPKSLDFLTSIYTRQPYYKDQIHGNRWEYNSLDATCTLEVAMGIWQDLKETGQEKFYFNHVHPLIIDFMYVQRKGVAVDEECCAEAIKVLQGEADEIQPKLDSYVGHPLNVNSPKQMITFLYTELGLPKQLNRKTSKPTADKEAVEKLAAKFQRPELMSVLEIRQRLDLISVLKTPRGLDGRMHTFYNVVGTETGRLASKESYDESGTNLQNIAKGWGRKIFIPDPGKILIGADLSQAEARYVAWDAQDLNLIGIFTSGGDVHKKTASLIFGVPEHEITPDQRQNAKKTVHASNYGMSYRTFARQHKIPESAAMRLQGSYFKAFPMIKLWQLSIMNEVKRTRELTNVFGRKHYFHGRYGDDLWKQAYAYLPQSTIADQMHRATHAIIARLPEGADYLLQVHDAIYCQCFPEQEAEVRAIMKEEMERPFIVKGKSLSIPADFHVGANWNECG
jgi:DNA polymerase-1